MRSLMIVAGGVIVVGFLMSLLPTTTPTNQHSSCWYKMQAAARFHNKNGSPEQISADADNFCAIARDLARNSNLSLSQAEETVSHM